MNTETEGEDGKLFKIWFQINEQQPIMISGLQTNVYARVKHNDEHAYNFFMKCVKTGKIINNEPIEVLYKSIDDVDYTRVEYMLPDEQQLPELETSDETQKETMDQLINFFYNSDSDDSEIAELFISDSSDDEQNLIISVYEIIQNDRSDLNKIPKVKNYVENIVNHLNAEDFKKHFRLYPASFEIILNLICPILEPNHDFGNKSILIKNQLLMSLWFMATPESFRSVSDRFGVGKATCF